MLFGGLLLAGLLVWRGERPALGRAMPWVLAAAAAFALDLVFWHRSILAVGTGLATLLANFQVFLVAIASVALFGERGGRQHGQSVLQMDHAVSERCSPRASEDCATPRRPHYALRRRARAPWGRVGFQRAAADRLSLFGQEAPCALAPRAKRIATRRTT